MTACFNRTFLIVADAPRLQMDVLTEGLLKYILSELKSYAQDHPESHVRFGAMSMGQGSRWYTNGIEAAMPANITAPTPAEPAGWDVLVPALLDKSVTDALDSADIPVLIFLCSRKTDPTWDNHKQALLNHPSLARTVKLVCALEEGAGQHLAELLAPDVKMDAIETLIQRVRSLLEPAAVPANRMDAHKAAYLAGVVTQQTPEKATIAPVPTSTENGRAKCRMMKVIRKAIADANGIPYEITVCPSTEHCNGACPRCDAEARALSSALTAQAAAGKAIAMPGMTADLEEYLQPDCLTVVPPEDDDNPLLPGTIPPEPEWFGGMEAYGDMEFL